MEIGITLPSHLTGVRAHEVLTWAARAEQLGFSQLAVMDRVVYDDLEALTALTAAAVVTERIGLLTNVLIVPQRISSAVVAKQLATLDAFARQRLTVGIGVGDRARDYRLAGAQSRDRFTRVDEMIREIRAIWAAREGDLAAIGPHPPAGRPPILLGGRTDNALRRVVAHDAGWTMALGTPERFHESVEKLIAWRGQAGRDGRPRAIASSYFALGADADRLVREFILEYFASVGPYAEQVVAFTPTSTEAVRDTISAFAEVGADALIFIPASSGLEQLERLAELRP